MPLKPKGITLENLKEYTITEDGNVWSTVRKPKYLKGLTKPDGYKLYYLKDDNGNSRWYYAHRLVAMAYIPNPENKSDVDHMDNNKSNNHVSNLQWVTHAENIQLSFTRDGKTMPRGEDHWAYGKRGEHSPETIAKMSEAKTGENHPKFKGWYKYDDKLFASCRELADYIGTYTMKVYKMYKKGLIEFLPKQTNLTISIPD